MLVASPRWTVRATADERPAAVGANDLTDVVRAAVVGGIGKANLEFLPAG